MSDGSDIAFRHFDGIKLGLLLRQPDALFRQVATAIGRLAQRRWSVRRSIAERAANTADGPRPPRPVSRRWIRVRMQGVCRSRISRDSVGR